MKPVIHPLVLLILCLLPWRSGAMNIVSLKPNITMILMDFGAADDIAGVTRFCPKPNKRVQIVADYVSLNAEAIVRLKPDLVLSSRENSQNRQYETLMNAGIPVEVLDFRTLDDLMDSLQKIGSLIQRQEAANRSIKKMRQVLQEVRVELASIKSKTFAVIVQRQPLMTASGGTYISTLLSAVGLKNVFEKNRIAYPSLHVEMLLQKKPDYLFDMDMTPGIPRGHPYYGISVIPLAIEEFLAAPQSAEHLRKIIPQLKLINSVTPMNDVQ